MNPGSLSCTWGGRTITRVSLACRSGSLLGRITSQRMRGLRGRRVTHGLGGTDKVTEGIISSLMQLKTLKQCMMRRRAEQAPPLGKKVRVVNYSHGCRVCLHRSRETRELSSLPPSHLSALCDSCVLYYCFCCCPVRRESLVNPLLLPVVCVDVCAEKRM